MNIFTRKGKAFNLFILSYLILYVTVISISGITFYSAVKMFRSEVVKSNTLLINSLQESIEGNLRSMSNVELMISQNDVIKNYNNIKDHNSLEGRRETAEVMKIIKDIMAINQNISDLYVYFSNANCVITSGSRVEPNLFYYSLYQSDTYTYEHWREMIEEDTGFSYAFMEKKAGAVKSLSLCLIYSEKSTSENWISVVAAMDTELFTQAVEKGSLSNSSIVSSDLQGNIKMLNSFEMLPYNIKINKDIREIEQFVDMKKYIISYANSSVTPFNYAMITPIDSFNQSVNKLLNIIIINLTISLFIGILISILFSKFNYNPLKEIMNQFSRLGEKKDLHGNEYLLIKENINQLINEKTKLSAIYANNRSIIYNAYIKKLLNHIGEVEGEALKDLNLPDNTTEVVLMAIQIDDIGDYFETDGNTDSKAYELVNFAVSNIAQELIQENYYGCCAEIDTRVVCIISFGIECDDPLQEAIQFANQVCEILKQTLHIKAFIGVGDICKKPFIFSEAYSEAIHALEYSILPNCNNVIVYAEEKQRLNIYEYKTSHENILINYIRSYDKGKALQYMQDLFDINTNNNVSIEMIKCFLYDIAGTVTNLVEEVNDAKLQSNLKNKLIDIKDNWNIEKRKRQLRMIISELCEYYKSTNEANSIGYDVIVYIKQNYAMQNLSVSMIGNEFNLTPSYLSKLFQMQTNVALIDYIHLYRMKKAKELLKDEKISINDISVMVGYTTSNVFIRTFKKYEGITPGQYRKNNIEIKINNR